MVIALTIKEMSYFVVCIFDDLVGPFRISICDVKFFAALFALHRPQRKKSHSFPKSNITYSNGYFFKLFSSKSVYF